MISKLLIILDELLVYKFKQEFVKNCRVYVADVDSNSLQPRKIIKKIADKHMKK